MHGAGCSEALVIKSAAVFLVHPGVSHDPNPPVTQVLAQLCEVILPFFCTALLKLAFCVIGGGLNVAYFSIENFCGGVESGLIWLTTGGFLKFYFGNTGYDLV